MTQVAVRSSEVAGGGVQTPPPAPPRAPRAMLKEALPSATVLLAVLLLTFVLEVTVFGAVRHERDQQVAYKELRSDFANALGPTGQRDADGKPLALGRPIALLNIPAIGLNEVVLEGTTSEVLTRGPGHRRDTVFPGQPGTSVIYGRQAAYGGPFRSITALRSGDVIEVVTGQSAETVTYEVTGLRRAGDEDEVTTDPQAGRLTLVTGDGPLFMPSGTVRVDATLVSDPLDAPGLAFGSDALDGSEQAMSGDDGRALALFLWAQLLLVVAIAMAWVASVWGRWQSWIVGVPVLGVVGFKVASLLALLLPNLL